MNELLAIFLSMALINNFVLSKFLGLCPFFGVSRKLSNALSMGIAVLIVMIAASVVTWFIFELILVEFDAQFMSTVIFILVIASLVQIIEMWIKRTNISLYNALGIYLPLITTNCAVLGITFINTREGYNLIETIVSAVGAGLGFTLVLAMMSGLRERLELADVPKSFEGMPVALLTAMFLGLAFLGFGGMV